MIMSLLSPEGDCRTLSQDWLSCIFYFKKPKYGRTLQMSIAKYQIAMIKHTDGMTIHAVMKYKYH